MSSKNPPQFDLHLGPFLSKPASDDWDTQRPGIRAVLSHSMPWLSRGLSGIGWLLEFAPLQGSQERPP